MNVRQGSVHLGLASLLLAGLPGCGGGGVSAGAGAKVQSVRADGSKPSGTDREAADFVRAQIDAHWVKSRDGWTSELQLVNVFGQPLQGTPNVLYRQLRELKFTIEPEEVTEAQRLNGADYRAAVDFERTPERHYRTVADYEGPEGWSMWNDTDPSFLIAVERRNGEWLIGDSDLFGGIQPDPAEVPAGN